MTSIWPPRHPGSSAVWNWRLACRLYASSGDRREASSAAAKTVTPGSLTVSARDAFMDGAAAAPRARWSGNDALEVARGGRYRPRVVSRRHRAGEHPRVEIDVAVDHHVSRNAIASEVSAALRVDSGGASDSLDHALDVVDEEAGDPLLDELGRRLRFFLAVAAVLRARLRPIDGDAGEATFGFGGGVLFARAWPSRGDRCHARPGGTRESFRLLWR